MKKLITLALAAAALQASATQYVVDGLRYDCTGSGFSARAAVMPASASDEPYAGDIIIPESITIASIGRTYNVYSIKKEAFANSAITSVSIADCVSDLGVSCFEGCAQLTSVALPADASMLPASMFKNCTSLTEIAIPDSYSNYAGSVFEGCTSLKSVTLGTGSYLMGANFFKDCTALEQVVIPDNFSLLGINVFDGCSSLKSVTLPASTTSVPDGFFRGCTSLTHYELSDKIKTLGKECFAASGLKSIALPAITTTLNAGIFNGCESLAWVEFLGATPPATIMDGAFEEQFLANGIFYVPDDAVDAYKTALIGAANVIPVSARVETPEEPTEEWVSRGEALFFDPWICSVFNVARYSWKVEVEESTTRPGYFRMKNPYLNGNCPVFAIGEANDVYINACDPTAVYIESQGLGFTPNSSVAPEFLISSVAGRHQENNTQTLEEDKAQGLTGFYSEGVIKIPQSGMLWSFPPYTDDDYYWCKHDFELRFAGAKIYELTAEVLCIDDYYANLWKECITPGDFVPINIDAPEFIETIKYGIIAGVETPTGADLAAIAASNKTMTRGRNDIAVDQAPVGRYSLIAVALDSEGNARAYSRALFDVIDSDAYGPWKSLGKTDYADVIMLSIYDAQVPPYSVEVEESESHPGIYRLKNVYSTNGYWTSNEGNLHHHEEENHFLYINAEDPEAVYIMPSPVGMKTNDGSMFLTSNAAVNLSYGYTIDQIKSLAPEMLGTLNIATGKIIFPDNQILGSETRYQGGDYYTANPGIEFHLTLPIKCGVDRVNMQTTDDINPRYFNLQGIEISHPEPGTPVIEVKGGKAVKMIR